MNDQENDVKVFEPTAVPVEAPAEGPVVLQRVIVEVLGDGNLKVTAIPQLAPWALQGLFSTLAKRLEG